MQADIHSLVILYVDCDLLCEMQSLATFSIDSLEIDPNLVVGCTGRNALREFANMIGGDFPPGLLVPSAADLNRHSINLMIVGSPDPSKNQGITIRRLQLVRRRSSNVWDDDRQTGKGKNKHKQNGKRRQAREQTLPARAQTAHPLTPPLF